MKKKKSKQARDGCRLLSCKELFKPQQALAHHGIWCWFCPYPWARINCSLAKYPSIPRGAALPLSKCLCDPASFVLFFLPSLLIDPFHCCWTKQLSLNENSLLSPRSLTDSQSPTRQSRSHLSDDIRPMDHCQCPHPWIKRARRRAHGSPGATAFILLQTASGTGSPPLLSCTEIISTIIPLLLFLLWINPSPGKGMLAPHPPNVY